MPMFKKLIFCTLFIFIITGCEKPPERTNDTEQSKEKFNSEQFVTVQTAKEQTSKLAGNHLEQVYLPEKIEVPDVDKVSEIKLEPWYNASDQIKKQALNEMWNDFKTVNWKKVKEKTFTSTRDKKYIGKGKTDKKTGYLYSYDSDGFFCGDSLKDTEMTADSCVKEYDIEWGDVVSDKDVYSLADGKCSVKNAIAYTEKKANQTLPKLEAKQFQYKVMHLYVMENSDTKKCDYNMVLGRVYKGISVDTSSSFELSNPGQCYTKTHSGINIVAVMRHKNKLDYINICSELLSIELETTKDKVISPIWAAKKVNDEVALTDGIRFEQCGLVYMLTQNNSHVNDNVQDSFQTVNNTTYIRPVWLFAMGAGTGIFDSMTKDFHGVSVIVDALTGELYYYDSSTLY